MVVEGAYEQTDAGASPVWPERTLHLSHEINEVITDYDGKGWWDDVSGGEVSDICNKVAKNRTDNVTVTSQILGIPVWQAWSNAACRCVTRRDVNLGDVTGGGLPTPIVASRSVGDDSFTWYEYSGSVLNFHWGTSLGEPFLLDTDGDGITDYQVYDVNHASISALNIKGTGWDVSGSIGEGNGYDVPVPGDYDGDGAGDWAVWNMQSGNWYVQLSSQWPSGQVTTIPWPLSAQSGTSGIQAAQGDYDCDGRTDPAFWSPSTGWYGLQSTRGFAAASLFQTAGDVVVSADFDGDGCTDLAYYRPSDGSFHVLNTSNNLYYSLPFGPSKTSMYDNLVPVVKDWDGDWQADFAIYWENDLSPGQQGIWYVRHSSDGSTTTYNWGNQSLDYPVDWFVSGVYGKKGLMKNYHQPLQVSTPWSSSPWGAAILACGLAALGFVALRRRSGWSAVS